MSEITAEELAPVPPAAAVLCVTASGAEHSWETTLPPGIPATPGGPAGGVLDGTYPNPGLAASVAGAGLAETADVLSVNVDGTSIDINVDTLRRTALTGDVTAAAGSSATTIANDAVTFAKMQNIPTDTLIGRDTAGAGDPETITLGTGLAMSGAGALNVTGAPPTGAAGGVLDGTYPNPGLAASVAGNGLSEAADVLSVNVDGTSIDIAADTLRRMALTGDVTAAAGSGTVVVTGAAGEFVFRGDETVAAIGADQNDYAPTNFQTKTVFRISTTGVTQNITGLDSTGIEDGEVKIFINHGGANITFVANSGLSAAGNKLFTAQNNAFNVEIFQYEVAIWQYDSFDATWKYIGGKLIPGFHGVNHVNGFDDIPVALGCSGALPGRIGLVPQPTAGLQFDILRAGRAGVGGPVQFDGLSSVIDGAIGSTRGSVLERGASAWVLITPGTSGHVFTSQGAGADPVYAAPANQPGRLRSFQILTSGTGATYTPTAGTVSIFVELVGGGGGGGGVDASAGNAGAAGGGGSGGYAAKWYQTIAASYTYTVGGGGAGGAAGANNGTDGTSTTFDNAGTIITASPGQGGTGATAGAGVAIIVGGNGAGNSTNGDLNGSGEPGGNGWVLSTTVAASGFGAPGYFGGGGEPRVVNGAGTGAAGIAATNYGGGGGGANCVNTTTDRAGGNGGGGVIRVWEFA